VKVFRGEFVEHDAGNKSMDKLLERIQHVQAKNKAAALQSGHLMMYKVRPSQGSNPEPFDPKSNALSIELLGHVWNYTRFALHTS
jgi:hypothetical protein